MGYMQKGVKVRSKGDYEGLEGIVTSVRVPKNCTQENHGTIEFRVTKLTKPNCYPWLTVGDTEHFTFYGWESFLEIL